MSEHLRPTAPSLGEATRFWLKLGCISFGGPAGQIAIMHDELVEKRRWISEQKFLHALNYCMMLPGPEAQQLATYLGWLMHRTWGGIVAGALFVLPSLLLLMVLTWVYLSWGDVPAVAGILYGIKPAVTALVLHAAWRIGSRTLHNPWLWSIAGAAFVAIFLFSLPFPAIIATAALIGYGGGRFAPRSFSAQSHGAATGKNGNPAEDAVPRPEHTRFNGAHLLKVTAAFLGLWGVALAATLAAGGWDGTLTQLARFFTQAALLTFGGAYAVLPYVYQASVDNYHWLTAAQMMDGLALGETTPGPLIMIVAFVGFVAAWGVRLIGDSLMLAGCLGALVATFFTFLPSFYFILAGGPLVESTHGRLGFTAPLTGISAAVVGVIVSLALFFAGHVFWPDGWHGRFEWPAAAIGLAAALALFRFRVGVVTLILTCGIAGLITTWLKS